MKKFLTILGAISIITSSATMVVACGQDESINDPSLNEQAISLATKRSQIAVIADYFNLNQKAAYSSTFDKSSTKEYETVFDENSIKYIGLQPGKIGADGGIFNEFIPPDFNLGDIISAFDLDQTINDEIGFIFDDQEIDFGKVLNRVGAGQTTQLLKEVLNLFTPLLTTGLGPIFSLIPNLKNNPDGLLVMALRALSEGIDELIDSILPIDVIQDVLSGLAKGSDLSSYANESLNELYETGVISLANALGYGFIEKYEEPTKDLISNAANTIGQIINNGFAGFDFSHNPEKFIENLIRTLTIFNFVLSTYRLPEVDLASPLANDENGNARSRHDYLFSNTVSNDAFVTKTSKTLVKDFNRSLVGLNFGELLANFQYYLFAGDQNTGLYRFEKLTYILLLNGNNVGSAEKVFSPLLKLLLEVLFNVANIDGLQDTLKSALDSVIYNFGSNKRVELSLFSETLWDGTIKGAISGFLKDDDKVEAVRILLRMLPNILGNRPLETIYQGDLLPIVDLLGPILGQDTYQSIIKAINKLLGEEAVNLKNIFWKVSLGQILTLVGVTGFENPNIPTNASYYTDKSVGELIEEVGKVFAINYDDSLEALIDYNFDFNLLEQLLVELIVPKPIEYLDKTGNKVPKLDKDGNQVVASLLKIFLSALDNTNLYDDEEFKAGSNPGINRAFQFLGFTDNTSTAIRFDSFLGKLVRFLAPSVNRDFEPSAPINLANLNEQVHDNFTWLLKSMGRFLNGLDQQAEIAEFIQQILAMDQVFSFDQDLNHYFNDGSLRTTIIKITFDPNKIIFKDGSKLSGSKMLFSFKIEREQSKDKIKFTSLTRTELEK